MLTFTDRGHGPACLLLHGFALDTRMWQPQAPLLDAFRLLAVNLPGFGPAPHVLPPGESVARALCAILDSVGVDRVHLVGHSLGGAVAVDFALAFAERTITLSLYSALWRGRRSGIAASKRCVELAHAGNMEEARRVWNADPLFAVSRAHADTAARLQAMTQDYGGAHWRDEVSTTYERTEPPSHLRELDKPALVIGGSADLESFRAMSDDYAATLPNARRVVLEGLGHMANIEGAERFNAELKAVMSR